MTLHILCSRDTVHEVYTEMYTKKDHVTMSLYKQPLLLIATCTYHVYIELMITHITCIDVSVHMLYAGAYPWVLPNLKVASYVFMSLSKTMRNEESYQVH